jgi:ubiquinone/menaquinone biosynthesis C-methylase UbiE
MAERVCPWWIGYLLASPLRRFSQSPDRILAPYVRAGMTVLEPGPGMGFFTLDLARLVGPAGRVIAVDLQPRMLAGLRRRAVRAGLSDRIEIRHCRQETLGIEDLAGKVDFVLAFAMVHELPDPGRFFGEIARSLRKDAAVLLVEPAGHVDEESLARELALAGAAGLVPSARPEIRRSRAVLLNPSGGGTSGASSQGD